MHRTRAYREGELSRVCWSRGAVLCQSLFPRQESLWAALRRRRSMAHPAELRPRPPAATAVARTHPSPPWRPRAARCRFGASVAKCDSARCGVGGGCCPSPPCRLEGGPRRRSQTMARWPRGVLCAVRSGTCLRSGCGIRREWVTTRRRVASIGIPRSWAAAMRSSSSRPCRCSRGMGRRADRSTCRLSLGQTATPRSPLTPMWFSQMSWGATQLPGSRVRVEVGGAPEAAARPLGDYHLFYPEASEDTDVLATPVPLGLELLWQLRSSASPETQELRLAVPDGTTIDGVEGGVTIERDNVEIAAGRPAAAAVDARPTGAGQVSGRRPHHLRRRGPQGRPVRLPDSR